MAERALRDERDERDERDDSAAHLSVDVFAPIERHPTGIFLLEIAIAIDKQGGGDEEGRRRELR